MPDPGRQAYHYSTFPTTLPEKELNGKQCILKTTISIIGCGWLGLPLAQQLLDAGYTVQGSTTRPEKVRLLAEWGIEAFVLDAGDPVSIARAAGLFEAGVLVLTLPPDRKAPLSYPRQIRALLSAADTRVGRVLFTSSTGVYPDGLGQVDEETEFEPAAPRGRAIWEAEQAVRAWSAERSTILRLGGLAGPDREPGRFLAGRTEVSGGDCPVHFVHLEDALGVMQGVIRRDAWGHTLNVVADEHPRKRDFYPARARMAGYEPPTFANGEGEGCKTVDNARVKAVLGYTFRYPDPMAFPVGR